MDLEQFPHIKLCVIEDIYGKFIFLTQKEI